MAPAASDTCLIQRVQSGSAVLVQVQLRFISNKNFSYASVYFVLMCILSFLLTVMS